MLHELCLDKFRFFVSKLDRQPMGFELMSLLLYTIHSYGRRKCHFSPISLASSLQHFGFVSKIYLFIYLRRVVYVCYIVFLIIAIFFFFGWGAFLVKQSLGYSYSSIVLCLRGSTIW